MISLMSLPYLLLYSTEHIDVSNSKITACIHTRTQCSSFLSNLKNNKNRHSLNPQNMVINMK
jgi:hypothetical protein